MHWFGKDFKSKSACCLNGMQALTRSEPFRGLRCSRCDQYHSSFKHIKLVCLVDPPALVVNPPGYTLKAGFGSLEIAIAASDGFACAIAPIKSVELCIRIR